LLLIHFFIQGGPFILGNATIFDHFIFDDFAIDK